MPDENRILSFSAGIIILWVQGTSLIVVGHTTAMLAEKYFLYFFMDSFLWESFFDTPHDILINPTQISFDLCCEIANAILLFLDTIIRPDRLLDKKTM